MPKIKARLDIEGPIPVLVNPRLCDLCGGCIGICPADCIELDEHTLRITPGLCIKCGFCLPVCPVEALTWNEPASDGVKGGPDNG